MCLGQLRCHSNPRPRCDWLVCPGPPPLLAGTRVEMTPWESRALQTEALRAKLGRRTSDADATQGALKDYCGRIKMKRNHDFSSSDSELDETIEVEKESADENG